MANVFVSEGTRKMAHNLDDLLDRWKFKRSSDTPDAYLIKKVTTVDYVQPIKNKRSYFENRSISETISSLSWSDLQNLRLELDTNNNEVKFQIRLFNTLAKDKKDFVWLRKAEYIQKNYASLIQFVQREFGRRTRETGKPARPEKTYFGKTFTQIFIDTAEETLPPAVFSNVRNLAQIRFSSLKEKALQEQDEQQ